jgi:hypothetical protein
LVETRYPAKARQLTENTVRFERLTGDEYEKWLAGVAIEE